MRVLLVALALFALGASGCGGEASPEARAAERLKSARPADAVPARATFAAHVDLRKLRAAELTTVVPSLVNETPGGAAYGALTRACGTAPVDAFQDVVFAEADDGILVAAELGIAEDQALRCIADALNGTPAQFQERQGVRLGGAPPVFAVTTARMLLVGHEGPLARALDLDGAHSPLAECLGAPDDVVVAACGAPPAWLGLGQSLRLTARTGKGTLAVDAAVTYEDDKGLAALRARHERAKRTVENQEKAMRDAVGSVRIGGSGKTATVSFGTAGDALAQVAYLISLGTGLGHAAENDALRDKAAEARTAVAKIADALKKAAGTPRPRGPVFPVAAPPVPAEVPRGVEHAPTADDFSAPTWKELGITMSEPFRYQYEVAVTTDRRKATVRARGDLDGDGESSLFEIVLEAKGAGLVVGPLKVERELE